MALSFRRSFRPAFAPLAALALAGGVFHSIVSAAAHEIRRAALPLGDGRIALAPARDHILVCDTLFAAGSGTRDGPWIAGRVWYPDGKVRVEGAVAWPEARIRILREGEIRIIESNGLPLNQRTGEFPAARGSAAFAHDRTLHAIAAQHVRLQLAAEPKEAAVPGCVGIGMAGITLTGVALYSGLDAMGRDAAAHEIQDRCNGHPQRRGQYHYHQWSPCIPDRGEAGGHSALAGYMLDGFGIYGPRGEDGRPLRNAQLDSCHGHRHRIRWDGRETVMYHYHFTEEYPYSIGCFRGTPAAVRDYSQ